MRLIGFSSGALAYSDVRRGVRMLLGKDIHALELSALRKQELLPLVGCLQELDLRQFSYVAVHAPSAFEPEEENAIIEHLCALADNGWPIVLHPDAIHNIVLWKRLGPALCIENMDKRKPVGRTAPELSLFFDALPDASLCFDIGHARQVDATMTEAYFILKQFGSRLRQVHVSEVNTRSKHDPLSLASILAFQDVADLIPANVPLILETPVDEDDISLEVCRAHKALPMREFACAD